MLKGLDHGMDTIASTKYVDNRIELRVFERQTTVAVERSTVVNYRNVKKPQCPSYDQIRCVHIDDLSKLTP